MALTEKLTAIADAIRAKTGTGEEMTLTEMAEAVAGISVGENLPEAESVSFSAVQNIPDERYSIGHNWFARVVERLRVMVNSNRDFTPEEIVYWLGRVAFIPQGWASSSLQSANMETVGSASGIIATVYRGSASGELVMGEMNCTGTASGILEE